MEFQYRSDLAGYPVRPAGVDAEAAASRRARRESGLICTAALICAATGILGLFTTAARSIDDNYHDYLVSLARAAATLVDPGLHQAIRRPDQQNGPLYNQTVEPLRRLRRAVPDIHYIYTVVRDGPVVRFMLDAADPEARTPSGLPEQAGVGQVYRNVDLAMSTALGDESHPASVAATSQPMPDDWGTFMSGLAPLRDAAGHVYGAIGVDVDASVYLERMAVARRMALLGLLPAGLLVMIMGIAFYRVRRDGLLAVARQVEQGIRAARQDMLTGLPTRTAFMERLSCAVQARPGNRGEAFAVMFVDLDRFKQVNDTLGHEAGDELLRQISTRLTDALRHTRDLCIRVESSLLGRFGGDEFLILIDGLREVQDAVRLGERLMGEIEPPFSIFGSEVHCNASIGIVIGRPGGIGAEELIRNADLAMYEAKHAGRACVVVFNEDMHTRQLRRSTLENALRHAIGTDQMWLVYQPIVDLNTGRRCSVEALVRWHHPVLGMIPPGEFIPIAEESGLIVPLGRWVLNEACLAMRQWRTVATARAPDTISVNLSRAEISLGSALREHIVATLQRWELPPSCLQMEVTEREFMRNPDRALALLRELKSLGIRLAMDDFGTGTSSLSMLRDYPFDTIKIDRSFVQDLAQGADVLALIHATIHLIENLGMTSLAEGVEEPQQVAILQSLGCRLAQGYLFSRPVTAEQVIEGIEPVNLHLRATA